MSLSKSFAQLVDKTAALFSSSYDKVAADEASKEDDLKRAAHQEQQKASPAKLKFVPSYIRFEDFQRKSLQECATEVCAEANVPEMATPVYLILQYTWNDILGWTDEVNPKLLGKG